MQRSVYFSFFCCNSGFNLGFHINLNASVRTVTCVRSTAVIAADSPFKNLGQGKKSVWTPNVGVVKRFAVKFHRERVTSNNVTLTGEHFPEIDKSDLARGSYRSCNRLTRRGTERHSKRKRDYIVLRVLRIATWDENYDEIARKLMINTLINQIRTI